MRKVNIVIQRDGVSVIKTVKTFRSNIGILRKLQKQTEPTARIMQINGVHTLVCHKPESMTLITVA